MAGIGASAGGSGLMGLMEKMGPQFASQYKLDMADAIIEALLEANKGGGKGQGQGAQQRQPQQAQQAQRAPQQQSLLGPGFYQMFNASPDHLQRLTNSIVGARRRPRLRPY